MMEVFSVPNIGRVQGVNRMRMSESLVFAFALGILGLLQRSEAQAPVNQIDPEPTTIPVQAFPNIPSLLESVQHEMEKAGKPAIAMFEFSSQIGSRPIDIEDYLDYTLPYVGGFQYQYGSDKYADFTSRISLYNAEGKWGIKPSAADFAVYLHPEDIYRWDESYRSGWFLNSFGMPYDVIYDASSIFEYSRIYLPPDQPNLENDVQVQSLIHSYRIQGGKIVDSLYQIGPNPFPAIDFEREDPVHAYWISGNNQGSLSMARDLGVSHEGYYSEKWDYTLPSNPLGNFPMFDMKPAHRDCSRLQSIGTWFYFGLSGPKTGSLVKMELLRPGLSTLDLGYWTAPPGGIAPNTWIYREWPVPEEVDLDEVAYLRMYYNAGDGWSNVAQDGKITIYLDDVFFAFPEESNRIGLWMLY